MYKLRTSPKSADSSVYNLTVPLFDSGPEEQWIRFLKKVEAVLRGQNVTSEPAKYAVTKTLLKGDALTVFEAAETSYGKVTIFYLEKCSDNVTMHVLPEKAVHTQKCYIRRNLHLKKGQAVDEWVSQVFELNKYLQEFPKVNGNKPQKLDDAKMIDILEYGVPYSWRQEFAIHVLYPVEEGQKNFVEFCSLLETWDKRTPEKGDAIPEEKTVTFS